MEDHLRHRRYFVGDRYSIADIALYAYTHVGGEGGFDLALYPAVQEWLDRVRGEPRHVTIEQWR
jgi:glutathione S-transferase